MQGFASQFAAEVERLMKQAPEDGAPDMARIERELKKAEAAIERLLDRLKGEETGDAPLARLKAREAERAALRQDLTGSTAPRMLVIPTASEREVIYRTQVARLETLLTGSDLMVAANALLRELLGEVRVWGEPRRRYHKAQDAALVPLITALVAARPTYGYRRTTAVLNRQLRSQGLAPVNHKRTYRIMKAHNLLLARKYSERPEHIHDGKIIVR